MTTIINLAARSGHMYDSGDVADVPRSSTRGRIVRTERPASLADADFVADLDITTLIGSGNTAMTKPPFTVLAFNARLEVNIRHLEPGVKLHCMVMIDDLVFPDDPTREFSDNGTFIPEVVWDEVGPQVAWQAYLNVHEPWPYGGHLLPYAFDRLMDHPASLKPGKDHKLYFFFWLSGLRYPIYGSPPAYVDHCRLGASLGSEAVPGAKPPAYVDHCRLWIGLGNNGYYALACDVVGTVAINWTAENVGWAPLGFDAAIDSVMPTGNFTAILVAEPQPPTTHSIDDIPQAVVTSVYSIGRILVTMESEDLLSCQHITSFRVAGKDELATFNPLQLMEPPGSAVPLLLGGAGLAALALAMRQAKRP